MQPLDANALDELEWWANSLQLLPLDVRENRLSKTFLTVRQAKTRETHAACCPLSRPLTAALLATTTTVQGVKEAFDTIAYVVEFRRCLPTAFVVDSCWHGWHGSGGTAHTRPAGMRPCPPLSAGRQR